MVEAPSKDHVIDTLAFRDAHGGRCGESEMGSQCCNVQATKSFDLVLLLLAGSLGSLFPSSILEVIP